MKGKLKYSDLFQALWDCGIDNATQAQINDLKSLIFKNPNKTIQQLINDNKELLNIKIMETKTTSASVRIMLSHNYSNFEFSMHLENPDGVQPTEIEDARKKCQALATAAVMEYKIQAIPNQKEEIKKIENKLSELKKLGGLEPEVDPAETERIKNLPGYQSKKQAVKKIPKAK